jgi:uncharacterized protein (TIGR03435 family)
MLTSALALGQTSTQPAVTQPTFEVASVKLNNSGENGSDNDTDGGRMSLGNVTLRRCMQIAYGIPEARISGGPKWVDAVRYDVVAVAPERTRGEGLELMLQALLAERFHLEFHRETKSLSGYALTLAKGGLKAKPSAPGTGSSTNGGRSHIYAEGCSMEKLATRLSAILKAPVADMTGAPGGYDFRLEWTPDELLAEKPAGADLPTGPSIYAALQEQLGLKLEGRKVPTEVLVIDRAEPASEN